MKKFIIISIAVLAALAIGVFVYVRYTNLPETRQPQIETQAELTQEEQGIQVTIESVERSVGQTIVGLTINNHVYDLNEFDIKGTSSFDGVLASDYKVLGDQVGGHHLEADLIFPGKLSGRLIVGMKEGLLFEFNL